GGNVRIDIRFGVDNSVIRKHAGELAALAPDVILANSSAAVGPLLQVTRTVPIVFAVVADPVGAGFVESLAGPGGNATGFSIYDYEIGGKWLELLKEIAPNVRRAAVIRDPAVAAGLGQFAAIQAIAPSLGLEVTPVNLGHVPDIERTIAAFARSPNVGLVVIGSASTVAPSRSDRRACSAAPVARCLPSTHLRHGGWPSEVCACPPPPTSSPSH